LLVGDRTATMTDGGKTMTVTVDMKDDDDEDAMAMIEDVAVMTVAVMTDDGMTVAVMTDEGMTVAVMIVEAAGNGMMVASGRRRTTRRAWQLHTPTALQAPSRRG
jgi:hypothetical protein